MQFAYRTFQHGDLESLRGLMMTLGYSPSSTELSDAIGEIYKREGEIFIAEKNGEVVGSVCVILDARLAEGVYAEIVSLVVSENDRGEGVGKALVEKAEAWAGRSVQKIRVRANAVRSGAHAFYKRQGFEEIKTQKVFIKKTEPKSGK